MMNTLKLVSKYDFAEREVAHLLPILMKARRVDEQVKW